MPNRATFVGGPPQFGQLNATGPCWPAGTIGCWIGGGGGIVRRLEAEDSARMTKMMTNRNGTQTNGANPRGKNAEEPAKEKAIAGTARNRRGRPSGRRGRRLGHASELNGT